MMRRGVPARESLAYSGLEEVENADAGAIPMLVLTEVTGEHVMGRWRKEA